MSARDLDQIRNGMCNCSSYHDDDKHDEHLLTTNCDILPSQGLRALGKMGAKHRPHDCPRSLNSESRSDILEVMQSAVTRFAREAEARVGTPGCMTAWKSEVVIRIEAAITRLPDGILLTPPGALPYSPSNRKLMSTFLQDIVCTPMDKGADTFVFQCPKVYADDLTNDLQQAGT